jgi:hypothetical protein
MTFGLCNAPATMQTMMDDLLYELSQTGKIVHYIDDIIIGGETEKDLRDVTRKVLSRPSLQKSRTSTSNTIPASNTQTAESL